MPDLKIAASLPGEQVAIAVIDLLRELWKDADPEQKKQIWTWWIEDMTKWRKFWKIE